MDNLKTGMDKLKKCVAATTALLLFAALTSVGPAQPAGAAAGDGPLKVGSASSFNPLSVTFVSLQRGWALGAVACGTSGACLALEQTSNAGKTWAARLLPAALLAEEDQRAFDGRPSLLQLGTVPVVNIRFANARDGWVYGNVPTPTRTKALLWSTHDGGRTWHELHPFATADVEFPYFDLEAARGTAYLMGVNTKFEVTVESTPVSSDNWHPDRAPKLGLPAGGAEPSGSFVFQGGNGWLVEGNDRGITGSARLARAGLWAPWSPPCEAVGDSYTVPTAANSLYMVAVCVMGGLASPLPKSAPRGATIGSTWLYISADAGASFDAGPELSTGRLGSYSYSGVLASPVPGTILSGRSTPAGLEQLAASFDGGYHWAPVYSGNFFYLGFTSPAQGVGLLSSSAGGGVRTAMVMSFDGGHDWSRVSFSA
jgi:hypothetical protein